MLIPLLCIVQTTLGISPEASAFNLLNQVGPFIDISNFDYLIRMATLQEQVKGWHDGERAIHSLLKVPTSSRENPTNVGLSWSHGGRVSASPLIAIGTLDDQGRPWTSVWGGERNFARQITPDRLAIASLVDKFHDPVIKALGLNGLVDGELGQTSGDKAISGLSIDLESRDRVKLAGKVAVGAVVGRANSEAISQVQLCFQVEESLGNCPKYLNKKVIRAHLPSPQLASTSLPLPEEAIFLIARADLFFLSSTNGQTMDTNHRGGPPGFMRVISNTNPSTGDGDGGVVLIYPEYSGNRLYQTLGNLHINPQVGIAIPDFATSDVLYLTGTTQLLVGDSAAAYIPHTKLAVKIIIHSAIFVKDSLPFRGTPGEFSPYNPPLRKLATETPAGSLVPSSKPAAATATLISRTPLSPTISRFTFSLSFSTPPQEKKTFWSPGQHITLDFSGELDSGWAHMNNTDPQSLNDDYVRTFTISNPPPPPDSSEKEIKIEITARKHGAVTGLLWGYNISPRAAASLEIPVLGFGGEDSFRVMNMLEEKEKKKVVFVAGGVGITPFLGQVDDIVSLHEDEEKKVELIWSLRADDVPFAREVLERNWGFKGVKVRLFVTGGYGGGLGGEEFEKIQGLNGVGLETRRLTKKDVLGDGFAGEKKMYFLCAGVGMMKVLKGWLEGEEVVSESFEY
ncbi:hypothetical protein QBC36DRAFT_331792 [Triangularia setosa]|uniref:FAD-binding FR-type domain-containing protein n=1 Tax=Triangularia setosa TaxID=2587417 RepID=A0AAN6W831_9PEZI|nr:hypothetical protein QBC36DRAFT_331792 [Podospora setosa]